MSDEHEKDETLTPDPEHAPESGSGPANPGLAPPLQEHLGRQLRTAYHAMAEKPAYLGDPAIPPEFDRYVQRLEARERIRNRGVEAVKAALQEIGIKSSDRDADDARRNRKAERKDS